MSDATRTLILVGAWCMLIPVANAGAQGESVLRRGVKIRIATSEGKRIAYVDTLTSDGLAINERGAGGAPGSSRSYRREDLKHVDVAIPRGSDHTVRGAVFGVAIGALIGYALADPSKRSDGLCIMLCSDEAYRAGGGLVGGAVGLPLGVVASALFPSRWQRVHLLR